MSAEYRFLRFEVVGIATIVFLSLGMIPFLSASWVSSWISDADAALAVVAGLFLFSLPLGYWEHQLVVDVYRSPKENRRVYGILEKFVLSTQESIKTATKPFFEKFDSISKNAFLTTLLDLCIYSNKAQVDPNIFNRLGDRWSHFYARRAVGRYAPFISIGLWGLALFLGYLFSWPLVYQLSSFVLSAVLWVTIFVLSHYVINRYAEKIWEEISFLEFSVVLANREKIEPIIQRVVSYLIEHPEYIERKESYGVALLKF